MFFVWITTVYLHFAYQGLFVGLCAALKWKSLTDLGFFFRPPGHHQHGSSTHSRVAEGSLLCFSRSGRLFVVDCHQSLLCQLSQCDCELGSLHGNTDRSRDEWNRTGRRFLRWKRRSSGNPASFVQGRRQLDSAVRRLQVHGRLSAIGSNVSGWVWVWIWHICPALAYRYCYSDWFWWFSVFKHSPLLPVCFAETSRCHLQQVICSDCWRVLTRNRSCRHSTWTRCSGRSSFPLSCARHYQSSSGSFASCSPAWPSVVCSLWPVFRFIFAHLSVCLDKFAACRVQMDECSFSDILLDKFVRFLCVDDSSSCPFAFSPFLFCFPCFHSFPTVFAFLLLLLLLLFVCSLFRALLGAARDAFICFSHL